MKNHRGCWYDDPADKIFPLKPDLEGKTDILSCMTKCRVQRKLQNYM